MIAAVRQWWQALSQRERVLVGLAAALALAVLLWLLGRQLIAAMDAGADAHREAIDRAARIEAKAALLGQQSGSTPSAPGGALDQSILQSASEAGLTLDRNDARGDRLTAIAIASARAPALISWLAALEHQGVVIDRLSMTPGTDGNVALTAELRRP